MNGIIVELCVANSMIFDEQRPERSVQSTSYTTYSKQYIVFTASVLSDTTCAVHHFSAMTVAWVTISDFHHQVCTLWVGKHLLQTDRGPIFCQLVDHRAVGLLASDVAHALTAACRLAYCTLQPLNSARPGYRGCKLHPLQQGTWGLRSTPKVLLLKGLLTRRPPVMRP
jgi:hypothetical protein